MRYISLGVKSTQEMYSLGSPGQVGDDGRENPLRAADLVGVLTGSFTVLRMTNLPFPVIPAKAGIPSGPPQA